MTKKNTASKKVKKGLGVPGSKAAGRSTPAASLRAGLRTSPSRAPSGPTMEQRHRIYNMALCRFDQYRESLCGLIDRCVREVLNPDGSAVDVTNNLPELKAAKRASYTPTRGYWWEFDAQGHAARRIALLKMIEQTAPTKRTAQRATGIGAKPKAVRRTVAKRSGAKPGSRSSGKSPKPSKN